MNGLCAMNTNRIQSDEVFFQSGMFFHYSHA